MYAKRLRSTSSARASQGGTDCEMDYSEHSDANMSDADEVEETSDDGDQGNSEAIEKLKSYLRNCEGFYIFSSFLKTDGEGKRKVYTGLAKCMQLGCENKYVTYTSVSRAHLCGHYQNAHPSKKPMLKAALAGNSRRGRPKELSSATRQLSMEESFCRGCEMDQRQHSDASMSSYGVEMVAIDDAGDQDNAEAISDLKRYLQNCETFYVFLKFLRTEGEGKKKVLTGLAKCMQPGCKNKGVTYTSISRAHLSAHYQSVHPTKKAELTAALAENCKTSWCRGRHSELRRLSTAESSINKFSQEKAMQMFTRWFVKTRSPLSVCEHPCTRELFAYLNPEFPLMSRNDLCKEMEKTKLEGNDLLSNQKHSQMDQSQYSDNSMSTGVEETEEEEDEEKREEEKIDEPGDQDNAKSIRELKFYLRNCERFYIFLEFLKTEVQDKKKVHTGLAKCMQPGCKNRVVIYTSVSRAHLSGHYHHAHPGKEAELKAALIGNSKRGPSSEHLLLKKRRLSMEESSRVFSQGKARQLFTRWFVETLSPLKLCEQPCTKQLFAYLSPRFQLISRRTLRRDLDELLDKTKLKVINLLDKQQWVATSANSWMVYRRAFLNINVHWIDRPSLKRKKAALACRELKVSHTQQLQRKVIHDVHQEFGIVKKVVATTTDSGTNNAFWQLEEEESFENVVQGQSDDIQGHLDGEDIDADSQITLPPHYRCSVHNLNLLATIDNMEVMRWWSSYLNNVEVLSEAKSLPEQMEAIDNIIHQPCGKAGVALLNHDIKIFQVLTEYRDVMKPVADTLNSLLREDNAYMGILLPTLLVLKRWLQQQQRRGLQYAEPLVQSLLSSFDKRFGSLFEDQDLIMASALHPSFTPAILSKMVPDQADAIKERIIRELKTVVQHLEEQQSTQAQPVKNHQDMVFKELLDTSQDLDQVLRASIRDWMPRREDLSWALFPRKHREAWVDLFIKYNAPLPSTTTNERMFSKAGDILMLKRAALDSAKKLLFLKENMSLLGYANDKGQFGEKEQHH